MTVPDKRAAEVAAISRQRLRYWEKTDLIEPECSAAVDELNAFFEPCCCPGLVDRSGGDRQHRFFGLCDVTCHCARRSNSSRSRSRSRFARLVKSSSWRTRSISASGASIIRALTLVPLTRATASASSVRSLGWRRRCRTTTRRLREPSAVDFCGLVWNRVESKACRSGPCGRLWTPFGDLRIRRLGIELGEFAESLRACSGAIHFLGFQAARLLPSGRGGSTPAGTGFSSTPRHRRRDRHWRERNRHRAKRHPLAAAVGVVNATVWWTRV